MVVGRGSEGRVEVGRAVLPPPREPGYTCLTFCVIHVSNTDLILLINIFSVLKIEKNIKYSCNYLVMNCPRREGA